MLLTARAIGDVRHIAARPCPGRERCFDFIATTLSTAAPVGQAVNRDLRANFRQVVGDLPADILAGSRSPPPPAPSRALPVDAAIRCVCSCLPHKWGRAAPSRDCRGRQRHMDIELGEWWAVTGSNCRPTGCKPAALPTELTARTNSCPLPHPAGRRLRPLVNAVPIPQDPFSASFRPLPAR